MSVMNKQKSIVVVHSGGMDSSICLALAIRDHGAEQVLALHFDYGQRHRAELKAADTICRAWGVDQQVVPLTFLNTLTHDALTDHHMQIAPEGGSMNTLVVGRNGLMLRLAAIRAHSVGAHCVSTGVIGVESANSGYRDCSRAYMDILQTILRIDLGDDQFEIQTPVVHMTKAQTLALAASLGVLDFLLSETVTCYEGIAREGCGVCPACVLRREGVDAYRSARHGKA